MAVRGITFSMQNVSSNDDSHVYKVLLAGRKGRTKGCEMTYNVDDIYISKGYFFAHNRLIEISSLETVATPVVTTGTLYCRLVFEIDMTKTNTKTEFNQGYFKVLSSETDFPDVRQDDLEDGGTVYHACKECLECYTRKRSLSFYYRFQIDREISKVLEQTCRSGN